MNENNIIPPPPLGGKQGSVPQISAQNEVRVRKRSKWGASAKIVNTDNTRVQPPPPPVPVNEVKEEPVDIELLEWKLEQERLRDPKIFLLSKRKYKFDFSSYKRLRRSHWDISPDDVERLNIRTFYPTEEDMLQNQKKEQHQTRIRPLNEQTEGEREEFISAQSRRIYVGNIPNTLTEEELMTFFNAQMITRGLIDYKLQKKLTEETRKRKMKPKSKFSSPDEDEDDNENQGMNDEFDVFKEGGPVIGCKINYSKNFAFLDFRSEQEATNSLSLAGMKLQNNHLKVRRPTDYRATNPAEIEEINRKKQIRQFSREGPFKASELLERQRNMTDEDRDIATLLDPNLKVEDAVVNLGRRFKLSVESSRVIVLMNLINIESFVKDLDYKDLHRDIHEEVKSFGKVLEIVIPRPHRDGYVNGFNKIFVRFEKIEESKLAAKELRGRKFQGRTAIVMFYNEEKYLKKLYE